MKQIFPAVFRTIWKRKETQIYLLFTLFSLVYLIASFFEKSNFMQISIPESQGISNLTFLDIMVNSIDGFILPTLALYFLTFSVFKKELDDHTMFLYRDLHRSKIFMSKYFSLILVSIIFYLLFFIVSTVVYYLRVVNMLIGSGSFMDSTLIGNLKTFLDLLSFLMRDILSITIATAMCLYFNIGATMVTGVILTITMMLTPVIGGPIALLFPSGYTQLSIEGISGVGLAYLGAICVTIVYVLVITKIAAKKFKNLEF